MLQVFKIASSAALRGRYRDLLEEDFSEVTLKECLGLVRRIFETSGYLIRFAWEKNHGKREKQRYDIPPAASDYLREFLERNNADLADELPDEVPEGTTPERLVQEAAVLLTFQSRVQIEGESGFTRDVQSLLFQHCLDVLSPKLDAKGLSEADGYLMHALYAHAKIAWTDHPSQQNYLMSRLYEHIGQTDIAMELMLASLYNLSVDEHDFVTKVQAYWSMLIESGRFDEAKAFVLEQYRRADAKDLAELQSFLDETYAIQFPARRAS